MADIRVTDKGTVTTLAGTEYSGVFIAAGDKKITYTDLFKWIKAQLDITPGNVVLLAAAQTLTNKALTNPDINGTVVTALGTDINLLAGLAAAGVTTTELGYLNGVTSAIQTQLNSVLPKFGEIYINGGATAQTVTKLTWTALAFSAAGGANGEFSTGITVDKANSKITIGTDGIYRLSGSVTFTSSVDALTHQFSIYRDGSIINNSIIAVYVATGAQTRTVFFSCLYKEGAQPKDYQIRYYHNHSTDNNITISNANFIVQRISS